MFHDIQCGYCKQCGDITLDLVEGERLFKLMKEFMKRVDSQS